MKDWMKHLLVLLIFVASTLAYFSVKFDGKELLGGDVYHWEGMAHEQKAFYNNGENDEVSYWCSSMFSGMPAYTVTGCGLAPNPVTTVMTKVLYVLGDKDGGIVLCSLICMYALLIVLGCSIPVAVFGAFAFALSSYSFIIIAAGHVIKAWAMAFMPLVLLGMAMLVKKKNKFLSTLVFTVALYWHITFAHYQITYYFALLCLAIYLGYLIYSLKKGDKKDLLVNTGCLFVGVLIAVLMNSPKLMSNYELGQQSIRGKSELTAQVDGKTDKSSGLDQGYAFAWSYGKAETFTLLIPNIYGGESGGVLDRKNSHLAKEMKKHGAAVPKTLRMNTYWGDQPFTSGPVYFGAIVCFLACFAMFYIKSKFKWVLFASTIFFMILSLGKNAGINDFFFHYLPMYNKFRTPSMALVIPQLVFALMAALALDKYMTKDLDKTPLPSKLFGEISTDRFSFSFYASLILTAGVCLLVWIAPGIFGDFVAPQDEAQLANYPDWFVDALVADRKDLASDDAFRSFVFIMIAAALMWIFSRHGMVKNRKFVAVAIAFLTLIDLWSVDKRYLNDDNYIKQRAKSETRKPTKADEFILSDNAVDFRVLSLNNPFNNSEVSYFHHSIGGYNAAKLRRYQDLIEQCIEPEMKTIITNLQKARTAEDVEGAFASTKVLNMLNTKYIIYNNDAAPIENPKRNGDAWVVGDVKFVKDADSEMNMLKELDPSKTAIINEEFKSLVTPFEMDSTAKVELTLSHP
ncbi:MAG: hypothetical protein IKV67_11775, partial [Paludibacteraceae bacterium]|nr:hypothetical protein [Paludibacteraceae bacterium]